MSKQNKSGLITFADVENIFDAPFKNDRERIKYMSKAYSSMGIAKAFATFYGLEVPNEVKSNRFINMVNTVTVGKTYNGIVKEFTKTSLTFELPGVKEELICKENFASCFDKIQNYLLTHDNKMLFEVREKRNGAFIVSVINAYYKLWVDRINKVIEHEDAIYVHIDELVKGGYIGHTDITPLVELTGKSYTSSIFIPGSHIVLNIEKNFEKWVGQDVYIVPQKFVEFRKDLATGATENSLVGSRKKVLQVLGMKNMYDIYTEIESKKKLAELASSASVARTTFEGTVTGIINSAKKTGIFVELNDKYITGLMPADASTVCDYKPGDPITVAISEFEVQDGKEPFILNKKGNVVKCNVRPVFEIA